MSKHNRERRTFRKAKAGKYRPSNGYETTRMFKHGKRRLRGQCWQPTKPSL